MSTLFKLTNLTVEVWANIQTPDEVSQKNVLALEEKLNEFCSELEKDHPNLKFYTKQ